MLGVGCGVPETRTARGIVALTTALTLVCNDDDDNDGDNDDDNDDDDDDDNNNNDDDDNDDDDDDNDNNDDDDNDDGNDHRVTRLLPKAELFRLNQTARANNIAFLMAITSGVTASIFSDFGPKHLITDKDGEPLDTQAVRNIEVLAPCSDVFKISGVKEGERVCVITTDSLHGLDDGDTIELDDMNGKLAPVRSVGE